jgi:uncharacterized membrane protein YgcG
VLLGATVAATLAPPPFALVPPHPGTSVIYGYQVDATSPRGTQSARGVVIVTRLANGRAVVTLAPDLGAASAVAAAVGADGSLHAAPPSSDETPGEGFGRAPAPIPPGLRALTALLAAPANGTSWPVAVEAGDPGALATIGLSAHAVQHATDLTVSADGSGNVQIGQAPAGRERGGFRGGGGGGGGGFGFPGGGGGGRRRGGDEAAQRVPATLALHVEASFRGTTFLGARGTETTTPQQGDTTPRTATWSLWPY